MIVETSIPEVKQIVDSADERELWTVIREHEREPFFFPNEGVGNRLNRAARVVTEGRITPNSDGSYTVEGSGKRWYRCAESCSCAASQKGKSKWCYHMVAVALYVEWQRRLHPPQREGSKGIGSEERGGKSGSDPSPLTPLLPAPSLPLPPVTVDERLAQAVPPLPEQLAAAVAAQVALGTIEGATALQTSHTPQEDRMPDDEYIPEPDTQDAPVTVLERPTPERARVAAAVAAGHAAVSRTPQVDDLEAALQVWTTERAVVQRFLKQELKANIDYYTLRIGGKDSKPSLSKAGAEKVLGWLKIQASFLPDTGTWEMLGRPQDLLCYVCTLRTRSGEIVGEGRGARSLKKDGGDVNKAIKMAEKSSMVSAVLRTGALSDVFTQDLEDMQEPETAKVPAKAPAKPLPPAPPHSADLRKRIWAEVNRQAPQIKTQDDAEAWVHQETGYVMHHDNYRDIVESLETRA